MSENGETYNLKSAIDKFDDFLSDWNDARGLIVMLERQMEEHCRKCGEQWQIPGRVLRSTVDWADSVRDHLEGLLKEGADGEPYGKDTDQ